MNVVKTESKLILPRVGNARSQLAWHGIQKIKFKKFGPPHTDFREPKGSRDPEDTAPRLPPMNQMAHGSAPAIQETNFGLQSDTKRERGENGLAIVAGQTQGRLLLGPIQEDASSSRTSETAPKSICKGITHLGCDSTA